MGAGRRASSAGWLVLAGAAAHLGAGAGAQAAQPMGLQEALLRAKPAVALIVTEVNAEVQANCGAGEVQATKPAFNSTGTGWFIAPDGFLITNAHVVQQAHRPTPEMVETFRRRAVEATCLPVLRERAGGDAGRRPEVEERLRRRVHDAILPAASVKLLPQVSVVLSNGTRLPAEVKKYSPPVTEGAGKAGRDLALLKVAGRDFPVIPVDLGRAQIGDPIHILGFPGVVLSHELLNQSATVEASVTNGAVSGFKEDVANQPVIQTDAPAAWGNSGGPAVNSRGEVVGVLTFVSLAPGPEGGIVQGFNFVVPSNAVQEFLQGTEVRWGVASRFNRLWWDGLRDFYGDEFVRAERAFQEANKLLANLPDVKRMLAEAQERIKNPPPKPFPWHWAALGVTLASGTGFGGIWARRWWRNRYRITPGQVIALMEKRGKPIFLDARTAQDYEASPLKLPGAIRLPPEKAEAGPIDLKADRQQMIVTYCATPDEQTSARAAQKVREAGHRQARILKGGLGAWANAGLPMEAKSHLPAIGMELYRSLAGGSLPRREFPAGRAIFHEGDDAKGEAFIIQQGKVEIRKRIDGKERALRTLAEGELLGELALIREAPRSAGAVAQTEVQLLVINREQLEWLIRNRPELTLEIMRRLSGWLAEGVGSLKGDAGLEAAPPAPAPER